MNILVIPTTDWTKHPVPNRLNFIFDEIGRSHSVHVLGFDFSRFSNVPERETTCNVISAGTCNEDLATWYVRMKKTHDKIISDTIKENEIDVILSANIFPSYNAHKHGVPIVYDYLDVMHEAAATYVANQLMRGVTTISVFGIVRKNLQNACKIITVTVGLRNYILESIFKSYDRFGDIHIIPNGVDTELFKPSISQRDRGIVYVGSVEPWIDLSIPIRAMSDIDSHLHIYGPSLHTGYRDSLIRLSRHTNNVSFYDYVPYRSLPDIINRYSIGLNPLVESEHNKFSAGGKMFNYLACGVPMLTTRHCSPPYPHNDEAYWFYNNVDDFRNAVEDILSRTPNRAMLHAMSRKYDWKNISDEYFKVLEEAVM